jgi:hypothetical protein
MNALSPADFEAAAARLITARSMAAPVIQRLALQAAYASDDEHRQIRGLIRELRQIFVLN